MYVIILSAVHTMAVLPKHGRFVCVKPTHEYNETEEDSCEEWLSVVSSSERYFTSHTYQSFAWCLLHEHHLQLVYIQCYKFLNCWKR